jgi:hypothetical protein
LRRETSGLRAFRDSCRWLRRSGHRLSRDGPRERTPANRGHRKLEDAGFDLQWQRLSKDGAWMIWVFDRQGTFIDGSIQDDPQEALLAVCERLLPPQKPSE